MNEIDRKAPTARSCPICGKPAEPAFKPFCSKRCADIDLNRWLSGVYAVPARTTKMKTANGQLKASADEK